LTLLFFFDNLEKLRISFHLNLIIVIENYLSFSIQKKEID